MADELVVICDEKVAGTLRRSRGEVTFTYDETYRVDPQATRLSVSMPLSQPTHKHQVVGPWLDGLLPDNPAVRRRWGQRFGVLATSPFDLLGTSVGEDCAGAARFVTADRVDAMVAGTGAVEWLSDAQLADRLRDLRADDTTWLGADFTGRFSLSGAQGKTALYRDPTTGRWGEPHGAAATSHILKPAVFGLPDHDLNEHLCLQAAAAVGVRTATSQVVAIDDVRAIAVTRFDRAPGPRWLRRVHQEDMCQALAIAPDLKYQADGGPSSTDIAALLRRTLPADRTDAGVWQLFDALVVNWVLGGTDAHAKNYALLLSGPQVALAPLYDIASALPYCDTHVRRLRLAMKFGGDYTLLSRSGSLWQKVATELHLPAAQVRTRARSLVEALPEALAQAAASDDIRTQDSELPTRLVDAVARRAIQCCDTF
ncbi:MAG: type II toxin-antitoxin system HipA family toxin [Micrococcales bacterium]|nr:type II toxin-antitoxin system HipA family toxin [Micrococcales bacterium]MCL2666848.1 type II toxin-antitoxin system HipA family toxin [Micrococcales bacterium]